MPHTKVMSSAMQRCIDACSECGDACNATVAHCLGLGGEHAEASHIALLLTCADVCETSARAMLRSADASGSVCALCAEICRLCAADCDRFDDEHMAACAETCRHCADSCEQMASA